METSLLLERARDGDGEAFRDLTDPHRRELLVHCYRMLGSVQDAEDALQEVLLTAWQGIGGFEGRSSLRTWLYRIATNRCLNLIRAAGRRPAKEWDVTNFRPPDPTGLSEVVWLEPIPDWLVEGALGPLGPEARYEQTEAITLAFVTALQVLPPRQVAVLVLRDVLGFSAADVAEMLDTTVASVTSALKRARAGLERERRSPRDQTPPPAPGSPQEEAVVARFVAAYESGDVDTVISMLTDDVFMSMPPIPFEYEGREAVGEFLRGLHCSKSDLRLVATRANGQPAFGTYLRGPGGSGQAVSLIVLTLSGDRISAFTRFESGLLPRFGLPRSLHS